MKEINRATIHHLNKKTYTMLTTHIKGKYFWCFLSFANFYLFLVMQIFNGFSDFANSYGFHAKL